MFQSIIFEEKGQIGFLTINKPDVLNALDAQVLEEIDQAVSLAEKSEEIKAMIITGEGRAFAAGADIGTQSVLDLEGGRNWGRNGSAVFRKLELLAIPTIAAVNGFALGGGCELAMACDMILASSKAKFGQPEVSLGITPGFSGTQRLPRLVGKAKAMELILSGDMIKAEEALKIGLVNQVVEPEELLDAAVSLAKRIIKNGPLAVKYAKAAINRGTEMDLDSAISLENELFAMCFATEDQKEGMQAFLEKRDAAFQGK
ncbi:enoyl-CoA hydratase-related protein [Hominibacterium faecale]|uniref:enoyl-CoA hydratase-related protein n=1 Tax=Hominibacterium faecale TaxID=2839743 RepID=UPI0022B2A861|nr:enoyl-CoA hydratase-related protein [Hominibacterium faecale]